MLANAEKFAVVREAYQNFIVVVSMVNRMTLLLDIAIPSHDLVGMFRSEATAPCYDATRPVHVLVTYIPCSYCSSNAIGTPNGSSSGITLSPKLHPNPTRSEGWRCMLEIAGAEGCGVGGLC